MWIGACWKHRWSGSANFSKLRSVLAGYAPISMGGFRRTCDELLRISSPIRLCKWMKKLLWPFSPHSQLNMGVSAKTDRSCPFVYVSCQYHMCVYIYSVVVTDVYLILTLFTYLSPHGPGSRCPIIWFDGYCINCYGNAKMGWRRLRESMM